MEITVNPSTLPRGKFTGNVYVRRLEGFKPYASAQIHLTVYKEGKDTKMRGSLGSPQSGVKVSGSIPVTGWALDLIGFEWVKLFREPLPGEGSGLVLIGEATFSKGVRPDVAAAFHEYPEADSAGWGYMLLTNTLPNRGNGTFKLHVIARNTSGQELGPTKYNIPRNDIKQLFPDHKNADKSLTFFDLNTAEFNNGTYNLTLQVTDNAGNREGIGSRLIKIKN